MARFEPFAGLRYGLGRVELSDVVAPPYDVVGPDERARLEARSSWNVVGIDLCPPDAGHDRYERAGERFRHWQDEGILVTEAQPSLYLYRMSFADERGRPRHTLGVIGALELSAPGEGDVLPHEWTMSKPKDDRLELMRACRANLSPVWCLSLADGLSTACAPDGPPGAVAVDDDGVRHELWVVTDPGRIEAISSVVASAPAVIADGHHRYETALAYRDEVGPGTPADLLMTYVVELSDEELTVRPIHRLLSGLPGELDLLEALSPFFESEPTDDVEGYAAAGAMGIVTAAGGWLLRPRPDAFGDEDLDSSRLASALDAVGDHTVSYRHDLHDVLAAVDKGDAQAGVLLRPATVAQIAAAARARRRMPAKTTFFWPKARTGLVLRKLGRLGTSETI